jgi:hypothetical protein
MKNTNQIYSKYKQLIPTVILVALCVFTLTSYFIEKNASEDSYFLLNVKHYGAFVTASLCLISFFVFRNYYKYLLGITLILGLTSLINFIPNQNKWFLAFKESELISVQPMVLFITALTYIINFKRANEFIINQLRSIKGREGEFEEQLQGDKIEKFKERYRMFSDNQLKQILEEAEFVPEALEAARQLLDNRQK